MRLLKEEFGDAQLQSFIGFLRCLKTAGALREALEMAVQNRNVEAEQLLEIVNAILQHM